MYVVGSAHDLIIPLVLDTAGQEEYSAMRSQFFNQGDGFLLVYSVTDVNSFARVPEFRLLPNYIEAANRIFCMYVLIFIPETRSTRPRRSTRTTRR